MPSTAAYASELALLASYPLFASVPQPQLRWLLAHAEQLELAVGQAVCEVGEPVEHSFIVLRGELRLFYPQQPQHGIVRFEPGAVAGYLPFSPMTVSASIVQAVQPSTVLALPRHLTAELAGQHFELTQTLVGVMTTQVRDDTATTQQDDRLAALGKLSAGLAHELNNPIAAVASSVDHLQRHVRALAPLTGQLLAAGTAPAAWTAAQALFVAAAPPAGLTRTAWVFWEEELANWLQQWQVPEAEALAESLVEAGCTPDRLRAAHSLLGSQLGPCLAWAYHDYQLRRLAVDAREAAGRVAELVRSIKTYTHMDQNTAPQPVCLNEGLAITARLLTHKFRAAGVALEQDYAAGLPAIPAMAGELNQVWTNLLDNALDALRGQPGAQVQVTTSYDSYFVHAVVADNGPGIPAEAQADVFLPFFTTKPPGQGTGLGLDLVQRIVRQHGGTVHVASSPGHTAFEVCLPRQPA